MLGDDEWHQAVSAASTAAAVAASVAASRQGLASKENALVPPPPPPPSSSSSSLVAAAPIASSASAAAAAAEGKRDKGAKTEKRSGGAVGRYLDQLKRARAMFISLQRSSRKLVSVAHAEWSMENFAFRSPESSG